MLHTFQATDFAASGGAHQRSHSMPLQMTTKSSAIRRKDKKLHKSNPLTDPFTFASAASTVVADRRREHTVSSQNDNGIDMEANGLFGATQHHQQAFCLNSQGTPAGGTTACDFDIVCRMKRGFFLVDGKWTCYRRNYFQLSCSLLLKNHAAPTNFYVTKANGSTCQVGGFYFRLKARLHNRADQPIKLIQLTPKRDKGPQLETPLLAVQPISGPAWMSSMLTASSDAVLGRSATFDRIQFKQATANNGKKRASQQYYMLVVELLGHLGADEYITLATCESEPLVVRGRSPGHYAEHDNSKNILTTTSTSQHMISNEDQPWPPPILLPFNTQDAPPRARSVSVNDGYFWLQRQEWQYPYASSSPKSTPGLLWSPHDREDSIATAFVASATGTTLVASLRDNDQSKSYFWSTPWTGNTFSSTAPCSYNDSSSILTTGVEQQYSTFAGIANSTSTITTTSTAHADFSRDSS